MCISIFIIVWLNKKLVLINKFSKYNRINISSFKIKYLNLYLFLDFFSLLFIVIVYSCFFYLLTHIILDLFNYIFFHLEFFKYKNMLKKSIYKFFIKFFFNTQQNV
jgi:hypothetical protein